MKKIVVPTDFSPNAYNAFSYALAFAEETGASILLLHVIGLDLDIVDSPLLSGAAFQAKKEAAETALQAQIDLAKSNDPGNIDTIVKVKSLVKVGNPVDQIMEVAVDQRADVIVMGARGTRLSKVEKFLGTRSSAVATRSKCPVFIIPENAAYQPIVELAYAADLDPADSFELWTALELIKPFSPIVRYLHVTVDATDDLEAEKLEKMKAHMETHNPALQMHFHQIYGRNIDQEIAEFAQNLEIDLLVIFHKSKNVFERWLTGSHTKRIITKSDTPLLVISSRQ